MEICWSHVTRPIAQDIFGFLANYGLKHRCPQLWMGTSLNLHHLPCHPHLPPYPAAFEGSCNTQGYDSPKHFENSKDPWASALQREQAPRSPGINRANTPLSHDAHGWSLSSELSTYDTTAPSNQEKFKNPPGMVEFGTLLLSSCFLLLTGCP